MKRLIFLFFLFRISLLYSQFQPVHPTHHVYHFISELANCNFIDVSTVAQPYSRLQVTQWLDSVEEEALNTRQKAELNFYKKEFNTGVAEFSGKKGKLLNTGPSQRLNFYRYDDSLFHMTLNPIFGADHYSINNESAYHWWNGAEMEASIGKWAFYGNLRDNHQSQFLTHPSYMNQNYGGANYKVYSDGKVEFAEFRGGISYDFTFGNIGLYKDHFVWGSNYNGSNILSGRTPSFTHLSLSVKPVDWFELKFVHAWLVSEVTDSARSYYNVNNHGIDYREVYFNKYMAANLFIFKPLKKLYFSFGNSIIYDYDNPHPLYFIPFNFFKASDLHLSSGIDNMNAMMFMDISARFIPKTHIYASIFVDELAVKRIFDPDMYNFISSKAGIRIDNLIPNIFAGLEYTFTNAFTFQHYINTTTFESNRFNLGHYLKDNAEELFVNFGFRFARASHLQISYTSVRKGPDHSFLGTEPRIFSEPLVPVVWESDKTAVQLSIQLFNGAYLRAIYHYSNIKGDMEYLEQYAPKFWNGEKQGFQMGVNYGF
jgi:hypothetical protein